MRWARHSRGPMASASPQRSPIPMWVRAWRRSNCSAASPGSRRRRGSHSTPTAIRCNGARRPASPRAPRRITTCACAWQAMRACGPGRSMSPMTLPSRLASATTRGTPVGSPCPPDRRRGEARRSAAGRVGWSCRGWLASARGRVLPAAFDKPGLGIPEGAGAAVTVRRAALHFLVGAWAFSIRAQASLSVTVRLKTGAPARESMSGTK